MAGVGRLAACSDDMIRACRITSAVAVIRAPGGGSRSTYRLEASVSTKYVKPEWPRPRPPADSAVSRDRPRSIEMTCVAQSADHAPVAQGAHDADACIERKDAQPAGFDLHHVAQVVDDRAGVADDYDSPAGVRGHDLIHHRGHALGDALGLLGEAELVAVAELERNLEQPFVDAHVRCDRLCRLERAPRRACIHRGRVELTNAGREPGSLSDAQRAERGIGIAIGHAFV